MATKRVTKAAAKAAPLKRYVVHELAIGAVTPDPNQPRKSFDAAALQALADSIGERGILQPILVRQDGNRVLIVDGERRWRAAKLAKVKVVPVLLADLDEDDAQQVLVDQVSVNQLREELKPMELARVLRTMRDTGKTVNEIAAMLSKQGHQAMTPAQITAMAALVDLPEWAHGMVDRDEVDAKAMGKLLPIVDLKGVEKPLQKCLHQIVGYRGELDARDVAHEAKNVLRDVFADLDRIESYRDKPVLFNWKTRCKGCEHLLQFEGGAYCRSEKLFREHQAEAKAEGLLPGGKRPEKPKPVTGKAAEKAEESKRAVRELSLTEKVRNYLHGCLTVALVRAPDPGGHLQRALVAWRALKSPGSDSSRGSRAIDPEIPARFTSLEQLTAGTDQTVADAMAAAVLNILSELPWRETHALARQVYPRLEDAWSPDAAFFELFRKAELVHLAVKHGCNPGEGRLWDRLKGDDIKAALLKEADKLTRPQILVDLYEGEIEAPYKPWRPGDDDEDDDGFGDDDDQDDDLDKAA
jgi:ParB/RepB/Spo0J family partition protein